MQSRFLSRTTTSHHGELLANQQPTTFKHSDDNTKSTLPCPVLYKVNYSQCHSCKVSALASKNEACVLVLLVLNANGSGVQANVQVVMSELLMHTSEQSLQVMQNLQLFFQLGGTCHSLPSTLPNKISEHRASFQMAMASRPS